MDFAQLGMKVDTRDIDRATQSLNRLDKAAENLDGSTVKMNKSIDSFNKAVSSAARLAGALAAGLSINTLIQYSDTWTSVGNQIRMVTTSTAQFNEVQAGVVAVAKASNSELGATASLYSTLARYAGDLVSTDQELLRITETLNKSFAVSGASAQAQEGAIRQLSQALASGALRGDEFNSVNENAPRIMDAVARSLNMTKGELREFAAEGGITSAILINAVKDMASEIDRDFAGMTKTFEMFVQNARTNLTQFIGESQTVAGAAQLMGGALLLVSENLDILAKAATALAIVFGGRFLASIGASVAETYRLVVAATQATVVTNVWSQRVVTATAAQNAMAASSRVLEAALKAIGGSIGLLVTAVGALVYAMTIGFEDATERAARLRKEISDMNADVLEASVTAQRELVEGLGQRVEQYERIINAGRQLTIGQQQHYETMRNLFLLESKALQELEAAYSEAELEKNLILLAGGEEYYAGWLAMSNRERKKAVETTKELTDKQKELIAALRNELAMLDMTEREAYIFQTTLKLGEDASAALTEEVKALAAALFDKKEALKEAEEAQEKAEQAAKDYRAEVSRLVDQLMPLQAAQRDIAEAQNLLFDALVDGLITANEYTAAMAALDKQLADLSNTTQDASKEARELEKAYERSIERIRDVIGDFFQDLLLTGKFTFDKLLDSFKRLIAEMIATAAANRVLIGVGLAGTGSAASASTGLGALTGTDVLGKLLTGAEALFAKAGFSAGAEFMYGVQEAFAKAGSMIGMGSMAGALLTAGGGLLGGIGGNALGEALFGKQANSNWGAAIGGVLGAPGGPIGSAIGAAIGGALDALLGGDGKQRVTLGVETDPRAIAGGRGFGDQFRGASGLVYTGRATRADAAAANELASMFATIDNALTAYVSATSGQIVDLTGRALSGKSSQAGLAVQDSGLNSFFGSAEFNKLNEAALADAARQFVLAWFDEVEEALGTDLDLARLFRDFKGTIDEFLVFAEVLAQFASNNAIGRGTSTMNAALSILERFEGSGEAMLAFAQALGGLLMQIEARPLQAALQDFTSAQMTMTEQYRLQSSLVRELASSYDGTLEATQQLSAALATQQGMAYELAQAFLQVQQQVSSLFGGLAESIRTSLMGEEELYEYQRNQVHALTQMLNTLTDPAAIFATAQDIERRVSAMWSALDETQKAAMGADFLAYVEETARLAQERLQQGIDELQVTQADINEAVRQGIEDAASRMSNAAVMIESAASRLESAAANIEYASSRAGRTTEATG